MKSLSEPSTENAIDGREDVPYNIDDEVQGSKEAEYFRLVLIL